MMDEEGKKVLGKLLDKYGYREILSEIASQAEDDGLEDFAIDLADLSIDAP